MEMFWCFVSEHAWEPCAQQSDNLKEEAVVYCGGVGLYVVVSTTFSQTSTSVVALTGRERDPAGPLSCPWCSLRDLQTTAPLSNSATAGYF